MPRAGALSVHFCADKRVRRFDRGWLEVVSVFFKCRDLITCGFFWEQLELAALPESVAENFLAMRARIEADRPIAEISDAG